MSLDIGDLHPKNLQPLHSDILGLATAGYVNCLIVANVWNVLNCIVSDKVNVCAVRTEQGSRWAAF